MSPVEDLNYIHHFPPTREAAIERLEAIDPQEYARSRNDLEGAVTGLSPYITHGVVSLPDVLNAVLSKHKLGAQDKFIMELGWREFFAHVWSHRGEGIFESLHEGPLPDATYSDEMPDDIRQASCGIPVIDLSVRTLYQTGYLHNHARMWLASYCVHLRKVHWRVGADWMYAHLLDGDLASNHLSWQWVAGTGSHQPYLFNADNVARYAPKAWHSFESVIDRSYEALGQIAQDPRSFKPDSRLGLASKNDFPPLIEPTLSSVPPEDLGFTKPHPELVLNKAVWLVHPWSLGELPKALPEGTVVIGVLLKDFHNRSPWSERRWRFVGERMAQLAPHLWYADTVTLKEVLKGAQSVSSIDTMHLKPWLSQLATLEPQPLLFGSLEKRCDSFSKWWRVAAQGTHWRDKLG